MVESVAMFKSGLAEMAEFSDEELAEFMPMPTPTAALVFTKGVRLVLELASAIDASNARYSLRETRYGPGRLVVREIW